MSGSSHLNPLPDGVSSTVANTSSGSWAIASCYKTPVTLDVHLSIFPHQIDDTFTITLEHMDMTR